jgi:hypothetical protein
MFDLFWIATTEDITNFKNAFSWKIQTRPIMTSYIFEEHLLSFNNRRANSSPTIAPQLHLDNDPLRHYSLLFDVGHCNIHN